MTFDVIASCAHAKMDWFLYSITALIAVFLYFCYRFFYVPHQVLKKYGIRGPPPLPLFGHYRDIRRLTWLHFYESLHKDYGDVVGFYLGKYPCLMVADLDMIKQITVKEFDSFVNRVVPLPLIKEPYNLSKGLLLTMGDNWKTARRSLSPTFSASKMRMMVPLMKRSTDTLVERFEEKVTAKKSFDVRRVFGSFTMETILAIAFGRVINLQKGEADELTLAAQGVFKNAEKVRWKVSNDTDLMKPQILLHETALNLVKARREESGSSTSKKDLLQLMIDATGEEEEDEERDDEEETGGQQHLAQKGNRLSNEEIVAHAVTFLLAGYETTANTLAYTSYLLALNPDVQEKLQSEIDSYFDDKPHASLYEATQEITYLDNVVQESLRLYPPAPRTMRTCQKDANISGIVIPKGTIVHIPIKMIHHQSKYWDNPEEFNPDRFTAEERAKRPQLAHLPFGFGPRNCIGMRFALLEAKMALIELLKRFSFVRAPDTEIPLETVLGITLSAKNGIFLKVESR